MNKYIAMLAALDWPKIIGIGVACAVAYYFLLYDDGSTLQAQLKQTQDRASAAKLSLTQTEKAVENANRFEKEVEALSSQFNKIVEYMPEDLSGADLQLIINKSAEDAGLRAKIDQGGIDKPQDFYQGVRVSLALTGRYSDIATFLSHISEARRILLFDNITVEPIRTQTRNSGGQTLTFKGQLVGYRYLKSSDEDGKKAAPPGQGNPPPAKGT